jgi:hypothetical protein
VFVLRKPERVVELAVTVAPVEEFADSVGRSVAEQQFVAAFAEAVAAAIVATVVVTFVEVFCSD